MLSYTPHRKGKSSSFTGGQSTEVFESEMGFNAKVHHYSFVIPERNA